LCGIFTAGPGRKQSGAVADRYSVSWKAGNPECRSAGNVLIRGNGVAARCCAHLLRNAGFRVAIEQVDRPRVPAIMLSNAALALIRDVFGRPSLFLEWPCIQRRMVAWGNAAGPIDLAHSAVVVSENVLLESLGRGLERELEEKIGFAPQFTVHTSNPMPLIAKEERFGSRRAVAAQVALRDRADLSAWPRLCPARAGSMST